MDIVLTKQQKDIVDGLMLGDGHLTHPKMKNGKYKNSYLNINRSRNDIDYLSYHFNIFSNLNTDIGIRITENVDNRTGKTYYGCRFNTSTCNGIWNDLRYWWYPNETKIVPIDLELNAEIVATWFCDDGHIEKSPSNYFKIEFSTDSFTKAETGMLKELMESRYKERVGMYEKSKGKYWLRVADYCAREIIKDIDQVFPKGMERKRLWKGIIHPPKKYSIKKSSEEKHKLLNEFLSNASSDFYLIDVINYINERVIERKIDSHNIHKYIKPYLNNGAIVNLGKLQKLKTIDNNHLRVTYRKTKP